MLALVIPTYNRPHFLKRLLQYLRQLRFAHMIVVADSSSASEGESNQNIVTSFRDKLEIQYGSYGPETTLESKIVRALDTVDSEYAVVCGDDDFVVPRAIEECIQFLSSNSDYEVVHGRSLRMYGVEPVVDGHKMPGIGPGITRSKLWTYDMSQSTNANANPCMRLREYLSNWESTFYSVHRRLTLIRNMRLTVSTTRDYWFGELLPTCLSVVQGKVKRLDALYGVRPYHPPDSASSTVRRGNVRDLCSLITLDDFSERYMQFRNCVADELTRVAKIEREGAREIVNHAFYDYITYNILRPFLRVHEGNLGKVARALQAVFSRTLSDHRLTALVRAPREFGRLAYKEQLWVSGKQGDFTPVSKLLDPHSPFFADFQPIYDCVIQSLSQCPLWSEVYDLTKPIVKRRNL